MAWLVGTKGAGVGFPPINSSTQTKRTHIHTHRLAEADPTAALRLAGLLVRLLNPIDVKTQLVMHKLWPITHRFLLDKDVEVAARLEVRSILVPSSV